MVEFVHVSLNTQPNLDALFSSIYFVILVVGKHQQLVTLSILRSIGQYRNDAHRSNVTPLSKKIIILGPLWNVFLAKNEVNPMELL